MAAKSTNLNLNDSNVSVHFPHLAITEEVPMIKPCKNSAKKIHKIH